MGASNEYPPQTGELAALFDRFLFRAWVELQMDFVDFLQLLGANSAFQYCDAVRL